MSRAEQFIASTPVDTIEIELPSNRTVLIRRPPLMAWAVGGTIPPFFTQDVREAWARTRESGPLEEIDSLEGEQLADALKIIRGLALWAFVDPRLEEGAMGEGGAVDPAFLTEADWHFLGQWFMQGSPGVPVRMQTAEGEEAGSVTMEDLHCFREGA